VATVAVTAHNDRVAEGNIVADTGTWGNDGGGGGVADEPDFFYMGTTAQSRKVSTTRIGREYSGGTTRDSSGAGTHVTFLLKVNITNFAGLLARTAPAAGIKIGSASSAYDEWYVFGNDNYPPAGGWQFLAIDTSVAGYKDDISNGTPDFTAVDYYSLVADFLAGSKGENLVIDAIDLGTGLRLTAGDGGSADGVFDDFLTADEGTASGRWGYVRSLGGIYYCNGEMGIGENVSDTAVATEFVDASGQILVWENGMCATGYHRFKLHLGGTGTVVTITGATFNSLGKLDNDGDRAYTTTEDTRLIFECVGTTGVATLIGCTFKNLADTILTSVVDIDTCDIQTAALTQGSADIFDSIIRTTSLTNVATLADPTFGTTTDLHDTEFIQEGAGHAIELSGASPTVTLTDLTFTGYNAADGNSDSAIYASAGSGTVTLNISGGNTPSVRAPSMTIVKVNTVAVTVTVKDADTLGAISGARVFVTPLDDTDDLPFENVVTITRVTTTATVAHTAHGMGSGSKVRIADAVQPEYNGIFTITNVVANAYDYTVSGSPTTPATGTILATAVIIDGTTNGSGVIENTAFDFTNPQDITGRVRKGTSTPLYKGGAVTGAVTSTGFSTTILLVADE